MQSNVLLLTTEHITSNEKHIQQTLQQLFFVKTHKNLTQQALSQVYESSYECVDICAHLQYTSQTVTTAPMLTVVKKDTYLTKTDIVIEYTIRLYLKNHECW